MFVASKYAPFLYIAVLVLVIVGLVYVLYKQGQFGIKTLRSINCGTVYIGAQVRAAPSNVSASVDCFVNAYGYGTPANLTFVYNAVDLGSTNHLSISGGSVVKDVQISWSANFGGHQTNQTIYCNGMTAMYNSYVNESELNISSCSDSQPIIVYYR